MKIGRKKKKRGRGVERAPNESAKATGRMNEWWCTPSDKSIPCRTWWIFSRITRPLFLPFNRPMTSACRLSDGGGFAVRSVAQSHQFRKYSFIMVNKRSRHVMRSCSSRQFHQVYDDSTRIRCCCWSRLIKLQNSRPSMLFSHWIRLKIRVD